ncbi:MAG: sigma 54-interacting transcriptional regulator [Polyangiaceae bacterium]
MNDPRVDIAKLLLAQQDEVRTAEVLLTRMLELTGADRGFVVAREGDQFNPKFAVRFDTAADDAPARFSRSLVRQALVDNAIVHSSNPADDPELSMLESLAASAGRAIMVAPLSSGEERFGAIYLEHPRSGGFSSAAVELVSDVAELAGLCLHAAVQRAVLSRRSSALERDLFAQHDFAGIITRDQRMFALLKTVAQIAPAKAAVLVLGESGSGKELIAKALHVNSERRRGPFVVVHCAALPSTMLESELFGHVRGAFTGADRDRTGRFASAHHGTLFLDEVAEIPLETQAKLLRAIQFGEVQRVGTDRVEKVDVRIVAATHADLASRVERGTFRQDLYYRLRVVELRIPPLRERRNDIVLLARHFAAELSEGKRTLSQSTLRALEAHSYPGNVRELAHAVERALLLAGDEREVGTDGLPEEILAAARARKPPAPPPSNPGSAPISAPPVSGQPRFERYDLAELKEVTQALIADLEREFVDGLLQKHSGNVTQAAAKSGIHRSQLQKMRARLRA